jgi:hypothetical protein
VCQKKQTVSKPDCVQNRVCVKTECVKDSSVPKQRVCHATATATATATAPPVHCHSHSHCHHPRPGHAPGVAAGGCHTPGVEGSGQWQQLRR